MSSEARQAVVSEGEPLLVWTAEETRPCEYGSCLTVAKWYVEPACGDKMPRRSCPRHLSQVANHLLNARTVKR